MYLAWFGILSNILSSIQWNAHEKYNVVIQKKTFGKYHQIFSYILKKFHF